MTDLTLFSGVFAFVYFFMFFYMGILSAFLVFRSFGGSVWFSLVLSVSIFCFAVFIGISCIIDGGCGD